jgi:Protein of unknown function (DUF1566)
MQKIPFLFLLIAAMLIRNANAQTGLNFQGVARSATNTILASQPISLRLSIVQGSSTGTSEYSETRKVITNAQGLFTAVIGDTGAISTIGNYAAINWKLTPKFLKIEMDPAAGTNFISMGTTQFQSVAYAQFAKTVDAENISGIIPITSGGTGVNNLASLKSSLALDKINNTADLDKPISAATTIALNLKLNATDTAGLSARINAKANTFDVSTSLANKVDKVTGKELSTNDFTTAEKTKLAAIIGTNTGDQDLSSFATTASVALKINSSDVSASLANKVDKVTGKELSTNDFTTAEKTKLAAIIGSNTGDQDLSSFATTASVALKINSSDVSASLANKVDKFTGKDLSTNDFTTAEKTKLAAIIGSNTGDQDLSSFATTASVALKANTADLATALALKEDQTNKSADVTLGGVAANDILFPTQKAVKVYVALNSASAGVADGGITTIKLADLAVTDAKLATGISKSKVGLGSVENTALSTWAGTNNITSIGTLSNLTVINPITGSVTGNAATATKLATATNINGVAFDGSAAITVTADAGTLTGTTLKSTVTSSSLTSVGTLVAGAIPYTLLSGSVPIWNQSTIGNAATATKLAASKNINGVAFDGSGDIIITATADAGTLTGTTLKSTVTVSSLTSVGTLANLTVTNPITGSITGNAATATKLAASKNINGVAFDGSGDITVTADAGTLTGATLNTTVTGSSLTSVGTIASLTTGSITNSGKVIVGASSAASASAVLEASSTTQGFLPPRMNYYQKTQITSPVAGLTIWCSNCGASGEMQVFNGAVWTNIVGGTVTGTIILSIGNSYQGGKVAYILGPSDPGYDEYTQHGLIAANSDQSTGIRWYNGSYIPTGATGTAIGTGLSNTNKIITIQVGTPTSYAAGLARAHNGGGYTDWYLPSKDELAKLYAMHLLGFGGFQAAGYWSSTEVTSDDNQSAWYHFFFNGTQGSNGKTAPYYVRAIRAF